MQRNYSRYPVLSEFFRTFPEGRKSLSLVNSVLQPPAKHLQTSPFSFFRIFNEISFDGFTGMNHSRLWSEGYMFFLNKKIKRHNEIIN